VKFLYLSFTWCYVSLLSVAAIVKSILGDHEQVERLGFRLQGIDSGEECYWFVASSVGEVNVANKLINKLKADNRVRVMLTVTTSTGRKQAQSNACRADAILYHPFDIRCAVERFLKAWRPNKLILVETELWPTLLEHATRHGVIIRQVAGRLSANSFKQYRAFRSVMAPLLGRFDKLLMQSNADAERIALLGGRRERIRVLGNPKSEYVPPSVDDLHRLREYLKKWSSHRILTCGSTRPGEEKIILSAIAELQKSTDNVRVILAPRHLTRVGEVEKLLGSFGFRYVRRSQGVLDSDTHVLLLDTIGELNLCYHVSDLAFVGGTLAKLGGHNLLEPALAGCPVIYGPYFFDQQPASELLRKHKLGFVVADSISFNETAIRLLSEESTRGRLASEVQALRAENASIVEKYVAEIIG
jgi:3-deoxy-D-manno-octulosonic-acid transferase